MITLEIKNKPKDLKYLTSGGQIPLVCNGCSTEIGYLVVDNGCIDKICIVDGLTDILELVLSKANYKMYFEKIQESGNLPVFSISLLRTLSKEDTARCYRISKIEIV